MGYNITFKRCLKSEDYMTKTFDGTSNSFTVVLKEETDIFKPTFILQTEANLHVFNYIDATEAFGRKYFILAVRSIGYNRYEVDAKTDVLYTWKSEILNNEAVIRRQEKIFNLYLDDPDFHVYNYERIQTLKFPSNAFMKSLQYVLVTNGAGTPPNEKKSENFSQLKDEELIVEVR